MANTLIPDSQIGPYRVVHKLGEGGMATAWLAVDPRGAQVVLKIPLDPTPEMVLRLGNEARAGQRVHHAHVVSTLDFFVDHNRPVLVIEYVDGCALKDLRTRNGLRNPLPAVAVAFIGRCLAEALVALHNAVGAHGQPLGMLHRDVTAANILIDRSGMPKLIDLGIARSSENEGEPTQVGMLKGTLRYLAPELLLGESYTPTTDLWSLGVSLFEAALGRQMVGGEPVDIFRAITRGTYKKLRPGENLDAALADALFALLAPKGERLQNARAAARMFASVEARLTGASGGTYVGQEQGLPLGQHVLAALVPFAISIDDDDVREPASPAAPAAQTPPPSAQPTPAPAPTSTATSPPPKVVIGATSFGNAATLQMPAVDVAPASSPATSTTAPSSTPMQPEAPHSSFATPTTVVPAVATLRPTPELPRMDLRPSSPSSPPSAAALLSSPGAEPAPGDVLPAGAATVQMPAWQPSDARSDGGAWEEPTERLRKD